MSENRATEDRVDPDIRRFVDAVTKAYAAHTPEGQLSLAARRAVAERVRQPWRQGGPAMAATIETTVAGLRARIHRPVEARLRCCRSTRPLAGS